MEFEYTLSSLERQEQLRQFVEQQQRVTVNQICQQFEVSPATARRDLEALAERGEIERFHGGAKALRQAPPEAPALQRGVEQADEKHRIGRAAAELVQDGQTVFLGSGTTVLEVARNLRGHRHLTVITNSLLVINALADVPDMTVVGLGGILRPTEMSMIGHLTEQALADVNAHKIIMGIRALDAKHGLSNDYLPETMTDRAILGRSGEIILVADHTKCDRVSTAYVAPLETIHTLITDSGVSAEFITDLTKRNIRVIAV